MSTAVLILAAGRGTRLGGDLPKQYLSLAGQPVLRHSITAFLRHPAINMVRAVIHADDEPLYRSATAGLALLPPVHGGNDRQESARLGLESLAEMAPDRVLIHDGARPLVDEATISRTLEALASAPGAVAAVPLADTLKRESAGLALSGVDRNGLWRAQTPQAFHFDAILAAHRQAVGAQLTDDAAVAENAGFSVRLVPGSETNIKVTTRDDLARAEQLFTGTLGDVRVGSGFDVHAFGPVRPLMLCGVEVPHERGLEGHSDADVGLHALTDAVLGALGAGDIGQHFPPSDPKWRGASSDRFLQHAAALVSAAGGIIAHLDVTIICERPKIAPQRERMRARVAAMLGLALDRISVKATTTEGLGFTGRGEGIAAQATATIRLRA
jgi:2-C-methyl-D-erythritol 4-phosphate cytidylyltransferase / 2-C-methyl-D-erythritol 2,4-cyclodiphosphate synthase